MSDGLRKEHDVLIYAIGIVDEGNPQSQGYVGRAVLEDLANLTGGVAFFPRSLACAGEHLRARSGIDLKNQYLIGYRPLNLAADGKWRKDSSSRSTGQRVCRTARFVRKAGTTHPSLAKVWK